MLEALIRRVETKKDRVEQLKALAVIRHKAKKDTLTRIALNGYAVLLANELELPVEAVAVYPFKARA